jgi:hypothetical protein
MLEMEIKERLIKKINQLDAKQLTWFELMLESASLDKDESDSDFIKGITQLQSSTDTFSFLVEEENFSEKDAIIPCSTLPQLLIG